MADRGSGAVGLAAKLLHAGAKFLLQFSQFSVTLPSSRSTEEMTYVIAEPCIGTKDTACVDACPVDCIHPKKDSDKYATEEMLYIDPVECIDCGACVPVCPVSAIFALDDLPEKWKDFTERNAKYFGR
jgi:NAD-dependent dihydropyrimidine dehydrogenase PreA subunit